MILQLQVVVFHHFQISYRWRAYSIKGHFLRTLANMVFIIKYGDNIYIYISGCDVPIFEKTVPIGSGDLCHESVLLWEHSTGQWIWVLMNAEDTATLCLVLSCTEWENQKQQPWVYQALISTSHNTDSAKEPFQQISASFVHTHSANHLDSYKMSDLLNLTQDYINVWCHQPTSKVKISF